MIARRDPNSARLFIVVDYRNVSLSIHDPHQSPELAVDILNLITLGQNRPKQQGCKPADIASA